MQYIAFFLIKLWKPWICSIKNDFISFYSSAVTEDAEGLTDPSAADLSSEFLYCSSLKVSQLIVCNSA